EAGAADGGIAQQSIKRNQAVVPALGKARILEDGEHQAGISGFARANVLKCGSDRGNSGERAAGPDGLVRERFDGGANGSVFCRGGGEIEAQVDPALLAVDAAGEFLDIEGLLNEEVEQAAPGRGNIRSILKGRGDGVGRFQTDGELVAGASVIGRGKERRVGGNAGDGGEAEIAFATRRGVREFLDDAGSGFDGGPIDVVVLGHEDGAVDGFGVLQNFREEIGLRVAVLACQVGRANGKNDVVLLGKAVEILEELQCLIAGKRFGVLRKGLRGDAQSLYGVAARLENGLRVFQEVNRFGDLDLITGAVEVDESGDGADLRLWAAFRLLLRAGSERGERKKQHASNYKAKIACAECHSFHTKAAMPVIFSPMMSLWMSLVP